jgi:para-aminobenzoate synthetase
MRTLLIDNHDSYTFNLFQLIAEVNGVAPTVMLNDDPQLARLDTRAFDAIVISPGPGRPGRARDIGYAADLLRQADVPILGVCLGHQAIAHQAGGSVVAAPEPRHGYLATVRHEGDELFGDIPREFIAVRYHSLCVEEPLPDVLAVTARAQDGVVMAVRHLELPRWGVQFHPESIATQYGRELLANFAGLVSRAPRPRPVATVAATRSGAIPPGTATVQAAAGTAGDGAGAARGLRLITRAIPAAIDTEAIFTRFFARSPGCFWLDSSLVEPGLSRFSFLGDSSGPLSETITYRVGDGAVTVTDADGTRSEPGTAFDVIERRLRERRLAVPAAGLPFDFTGGYVGYFGYEMKADCGGSAAHAAPTPDAIWIFADRLIAVDHEAGVTYLVAIHDGGDLHAAAREWLDQVECQVAGLAPAGQAAESADGSLAMPVLADTLLRDEAGYTADIGECQRQLRLGESYEICLTNRLRLPFDDSDLSFYLRLRQANPAPYAALFRAAGITVFSSSPERFLRIGTDRRVETRPIKGTAPRHPDPAQDARIAAELASGPKTRAENLMIVDLLRNDLGQVCEIGSVAVTRYMAVESYATVHQLVSTIAGQLSPEVSPVECVRHCFPGGSMTGAPKQRTMEIIDRLETEARGVYSGALGFFGLSGGTDLSIVIRTAVRQGNTLTVGAGGAIVLDSSPAEEYDEMMLKAAVPLRAYRFTSAEATA